jgi:hypothetical protein
MKKPRLLLSAALATALVASLSCRDASSPAAPIQGDAPSASLIGALLRPTGLLSCTPQPVDSAARWIGPRGGTISVGAHSLTIPAGALDGWVHITAVAPSSTVNMVQFGPQGLHFDRPATLTMSYANCSLLARLLPGHVAYTNDALRILELLPAVDNLLRQTATAQIGHFSGYALAY